MRPLTECWLYAFVDTTCLRGRAPEAVAQQLCEGGADLIQLRAKQSPLKEIRRMAEAILPVTRAAGVGLVINDHAAIAEELGAEFCHLGQEDFFGTAGSPGAPVSKLAPRMPFGLSSHSSEQALRAVASRRNIWESARFTPPEPNPRRNPPPSIMSVGRQPM